VRGETSPLGYERIAQNGYHYVKTLDGWRLKHHIIAEKSLGRPINTETERVLFINRDREDFDPANIMVVEKKEKLDGDDPKLTLEDKVDILLEMTGEVLAILTSQQKSLTNQV